MYLDSFGIIQDFVLSNYITSGVVCPRQDVTSVRLEILKFEDLSGAFVVLAVGLTISFFTFLMEKLVYNINNRQVSAVK